MQYNDKIFWLNTNDVIILRQKKFKKKNIVKYNKAQKICWYRRIKRID